MQGTAPCGMVTRMALAERCRVVAHLPRAGSILLIAVFCCAEWLPAQETYQQPSREIVVNLSAGRVVIAVVKDAMLIGTVENPVEAGTRPPAPVQISTERVGIFLGADEWLAPSTQQSLARLDRELPHLRQAVVPGGPNLPHLGESQPGAEATDIETIGQGVLTRLNALASDFHNKLNLPEDEPIAEVILVDYLPGYGPEVWQANYLLDQEMTEQMDYWDTRVQRPRYLQFWPPEKKESRTLVEFDYPPENPPPTLLSLLQQKDPRLQTIISSDAQMGEVADRLLEGESTKIRAEDGLQFLRAALDAISPPKSVQTISVLRPESGFEWVLQPPPEPASPYKKATREPGAPSLANPPHLQQ